VPKRHAKERLGSRIKTDTTSSPARYTTHEVVITRTTTGETPRIASMMEGAEKMSDTMGERTLGNRKLGLEMRHAPKCLKVVLQSIEPTLSEGFTELIVPNRDAKNAQAIVHDRHGGWEPQEAKAGFRGGRRICTAFLITQLTLQKLAVQEGPAVVGFDGPFRSTKKVVVIAMPVRGGQGTRLHV
jgi:hypothetical protein